MNHIFYFDGNANNISWLIKTDKTSTLQNRDHAEIYKYKVTNIQSKYIALHAGLFWCIGTFRLKNNDSVSIMIDEKIMHAQLTTNLEINDELVVKKIQFIKQIISQKKLQITFERISKNENLSKK